MGRIRVLVARLGLDAHWRGSMVVARGLRDAGMEVIYLGNQMPEAIARAAVEEDADVVGLSSLSGNHMSLVPEVCRLLKENGRGDALVVLGGTVPEAHRDGLHRAGVARVFGPGSSLADIKSFISQNANK